MHDKTTPGVKHHDDDQLLKEVDPAAPRLEPNRADINQHLFLLFHPDFVMPYPDAQIEVAFANPKTGGDPTGGKWFSCFDLQAAGDFAEAKNRKGMNIYVGPALRHGEVPASGRANGTHVLTAARAWADFDDAGDDERVQAILSEKGIQAAETIVTGTIPHRRFQVFFKLAGNPTPDGLNPGDPSPEELKAVNTALKTLLGGGDDVQNADRLMRLAGTISYPPPKKIARGYVVEPTKLHTTANSCVYSVDTLVALAEGATIPFRTPHGKSGPARAGSASGASTRTGGRSDRELEALLEISRTPGKWHNAIRNAVATMLGRGWPDSAIRASMRALLRGRRR